MHRSLSSVGAQNQELEEEWEWPGQVGSIDLGAHHLRSSTRNLDYTLMQAFPDLLKIVSKFLILQLSVL